MSEKKPTDRKLPSRCLRRLCTRKKGTLHCPDCGRLINADKSRIPGETAVDGIKWEKPTK